MKLTYFKIIPFILAGATLLIMSGCDGTTGISSDSGIGAPVTPPVTPSGTAPVAVDDTKNITVIGAINQAASVDVLVNDTDAENDINASSIQIVSTTNPGDSLVVPNEGTWSVTNNNNVRFTPEPDFIGDPTPIKYTVSDDTGLVSNEANVTIDFTQTYFENNTSSVIPQWSTITSDINASNTVTSITKVTVTIDISYTFVADLSISLTNPLGDTILLSEYNGVPGDDYNNTTFDDDAGTSIISGSAPFSGSFIPEEPLSTFDSADANGIWTLTIENKGTPTVTNTLNSWSINIE